MYKKHFLLLMLFSTSIYFSGNIFGQCSRESITAKYWQYRDNLRHFVAVDRDSSGCIHDGIGQDTNDPCICKKAGYGLPATSINMEDNSRWGMGDRDKSESAFYDPECGGQTGTTNNWLDMGAETPHQMGWYWVVLATEWKLLKENNQEAEAQRTLEELVLGLQAYKRLDIRANCLARDRYREITYGFETGSQCEGQACLCSGKYKGTSQWSFDVGCGTSCGTYYTPRTDGYSGFFLREDATQALESLLHDPSEGKWNIDLIGGNCYSMSVSPPCTSTFSQTCYLAHRQGFMSQDGVFGLMIGLAVIKRFIPEYATVTTCEGQTFSPLQMAKKIASGMTNRIDEESLDRISWPGSSTCCNEEVFITSEAGGHLAATIHGLKKACSYIDGVERHSDAWEAIQWGGFAYQSGGNIPIGSNSSNFWVRLKTLGWDMGGANDNSTYKILTTGSLEIMPLINNLLYPAQPDMGIDKEFFKNMLCAAPCGGPCKKKEDYSTYGPTFPDFECANNPNWIGQRWESHNSNSDANRQFNGLDFMALYNLYLLYFPEERTAYFNPDRPGGSISLGGINIDGPEVLCPTQNGHYVLLHPHPGDIQSLIWTTSANLQMSNTMGLKTNVHVNTAYSPTFVQVAIKEDHQIQQFYDGEIALGENVADGCDLTYRKIIYSQVPGYGITTELNHCQGIYDFHAVPTSPELAGSTYTWTIEVHPIVGAVVTKTLIGKDPHKDQWQWLPEKSGYLIIHLAITTPCGNIEATAFGIPYNCGPRYRLIVAPNPATNGDQVTVQINQDKDYVIGTKGIGVNFIRTDRGNIQKAQRIYQNGQSVSIANFPAGNYTVQVVLADNSVLTTMLVVSEK